MEKKEMTGFQGIFFDEINKKKLIDLQERKLKYRKKIRTYKSCKRAASNYEAIY